MFSFVEATNFMRFEVGDLVRLTDNIKCLGSDPSRWWVYMFDLEFATKFRVAYDASFKFKYGSTALCLGILVLSPERKYLKFFCLKSQKIGYIDLLEEHMFEKVTHLSFE